MKRINSNHLFVFGLCLLLFILLCLPFIVIDYGSSKVTVSGFELIFGSGSVGSMLGGGANFAYFLQYMLPILVMAAMTGFLKGKTRSVTMINVASTGVLFQIISLCTVQGSAGAGPIVGLILWLLVLGFSILDMLAIDLIEKFKAANARSNTLLVVCPSCGTTQSGQTRFCANCGATLPVVQPVYQQPYQQPYQQQNVYQPVQQPVQQAPVAPQPAPQPAPAAYAPVSTVEAAQEPSPKSDALTCPACGAPCIPGAAFCPRCGKKM